MTLLTLSLSSFICAAISGVWGIGGGTVLVAIMANLLSPRQFLPVHGVVQLISYGSIAAMNFSAVYMRIFLRFALGALIGAALGGSLIPYVPDVAFKIILAVIILIATWPPPVSSWFKPLKKAPRIPGRFVGIGFGLCVLFYLYLSAARGH